MSETKVLKKVTTLKVTKNVQTADVQDPPKIQFPCVDYPIKVMGESGEDFREYAFNTMEQFAPGFDAARVKVASSRKGRFESLTFYIVATGEPQLDALHKALRQNKLVKMVL